MRGLGGQVGLGCVWVWGLGGQVGLGGGVEGVGWTGVTGAPLGKLINFAGGFHQLPLWEVPIKGMEEMVGSQPNRKSTPKPTFRCNMWVQLRKSSQMFRCLQESS